LWLDADTIVTNHLTKVEDIVGDMKGIIFSRDWESIDKPEYLSAGNFIVTNCKESFNLLEYTRTKKNWERHPLWEQSAFREAFTDGFEDIRQAFHILGRKILNAVPADAQRHAVEPWSYGDFLCHLTGISNDQRVRLFWKHDLMGVKSVLGDVIVPNHDTVMMADVRHIAVISELMKMETWKNVLEIGVWKGSTTKAFLDGLKNNTIEKLTCCDVDFKPEFQKVIEGYDVELKKCDSVNVLKSCEEYDVVFVDGDHSFMQGLKETKEIIRREPRLVIHHDVTASLCGFKGCEGPAYAYAEMQANGWTCIVDCRERGNGEKTQRGMMFSTKDEKVAQMIRNCFKLYCY
jgi:hypothetical protein